MEYANGDKVAKKLKNDKYNESSSDDDDDKDEVSSEYSDREKRHKVKQKYKEKESDVHKRRDKREHKERRHKSSSKDYVKSYRDKYRDRDVEKSYRNKTHRHNEKHHATSPSAKRQRSRSRSRSGSRHKSRSRHSPPSYKRRYDDKRYEPSYCRSKDSADQYLPNKSQRKMMILEKLGIDLVAPGSLNKPQAGNVAAIAPAGPKGSTVTGELAAYCNMNAANSKQIMERIARKKVLWQTKAVEQTAVSEDGSGCSSGASTVKPNTTTVWQSAIFSKDGDNKQTEKFKRLMGIKDGEDSKDGSKFVSASGDNKDIIKRQEEMFQNMEMQYEVARASTHTHRGIGLGFGIHQYPR